MKRTLMIAALLSASVSSAAADCRFVGENGDYFSAVTKERLVWAASGTANDARTFDVAPAGSGRTGLVAISGSDAFYFDLYESLLDGPALLLFDGQPYYELCE